MLIYLQERISRRLLYRLACGVASLLFAAACGSSGCQGCSSQPIPGGFPAAKRFENAMQVRITNTGFDFVEKNFSSIASLVLPGGLAFDIPPKCGDSPNFCCGSVCKAYIDPQSVQLDPTAPNTIKLNIRTNLSTNHLKVEIKIPILGWVGCNVQYNSTWSGNSTLGLTADIDFAVDANDGKKAKIARASGAIQDFGCGDIKISGGIHCDIANWACSMFEGTIQSLIMNMLDDTISGMLKEIPMGQEGRFDVGSILASFSPRTSGEVDYFIWGGGYAEAEQAGMSLGVMGGFREAERHPCAPDCEAPGATCTAPPLPAIPRSLAFRSNVRPDNQPYDVGIGVDSRALEMAGYAFWRAGGVCLDISSYVFPQLSSDLFTILIPSIKGLTGGTSVPMMVSVRPRNPASIVLGQGLYHEEGDGTIVIDDPLITLKAKDFAVDVYAQLDDRMIRVFTIVGDLDIPVLLFADGQGRLQPMLGSLDNAFANIRLENNELITETTETLANLFPTILSLASGFLAAGFDPIELPSIQNLKLILDQGSITTVENNQILAIYAKLGIVQPTGYSLPLATRVDTKAHLEELYVPPTTAFRLGPAFKTVNGPAVKLALDAVVPGGLAGQAVEYAYRIDGGFYQPWISGRSPVTVRSPLFWLQGQHTIEIMARVKGAPASTDLTPAAITVAIDTIPPEVTLVATPRGVKAEVKDGPMPADQVELSWSINGGAFSTFSTTRELQVLKDALVEVKARDRSGNVGHAQTQVLAIASQRKDAAQGGCTMAESPRRSDGLWPLLFLLLGAAGIMRSKRKGSSSSAQREDRSSR